MATLLILNVSGNFKTHMNMKYYFYSVGEKQKGPFTIEQLMNENIDKNTLIWFEGLSDWQPAKEIKELEVILQLIPPPIPKTEIESNSINKEDKKSTKELPTDNDNTESFTPKKSRMFSNPFSFDGRIRRTEYGVSLIIYFVLYMLVLAIMESVDATAILGLANIPMLWFLWAQGAKRCHDIGHSGWYQIIPFYVIWLIFGKGEFGLVNKYGTNPKN